MKKILSLLLVLVVAVACISNAFAAPTWEIWSTQYKDLYNKDGSINPQWSWALAPVGWASTTGVTKGTSETTFSPEQYCTRGQIATFLYRLAGEPTGFKHEMPFKDVKSTAYYCNAVAWAYQMNIINGMDATHFAPNTPCTRAQIITMIYRYITVYKGQHYKSSGNQSHFIDIKPNTWYTDAVNWAYENHVAEGKGAATPGADLFMPELNCNRAEAVTFIFRIAFM